MFANIIGLIPRGLVLPELGVLEALSIILLVELGFF